MSEWWKVGGTTNKVLSLSAHVHSLTKPKLDEPVVCPPHRFHCWELLRKSDINNVADLFIVGAGGVTCDIIEALCSPILYKTLDTLVDPYKVTEVVTINVFSSVSSRGILKPQDVSICTAGLPKFDIPTLRESIRTAIAARLMHH